MRAQTYHTMRGTHPLRPSDAARGQGRLFGIGPSQAQQWIHVRWVGRRATPQALRDAPTRSLTALAQRLEVAEADATPLLVPTRKPRGRTLTRVQKTANRRIAPCHVRLKHVNSRVKRCRIVHDTCSLQKAAAM